MNNNPDIEYDIELFLISLLDSHGSVDVAEAEFKRLSAEDSRLRQEYRKWCDENGYTSRRGFADFAYDYLSNREDVWNALSDYDNED